MAVHQKVPKSSVSYYCKYFQTKNIKIFCHKILIHKGTNNKQMTLFSSSETKESNKKDNEKKVEKKRSKRSASMEKVEAKHFKAKHQKKGHRNREKSVK